MEPYRDSGGPPEVDRSILVAGVDGHLFGIDRATGEERWRNELRGGGYGHVAIAMRYGVLAVSAGEDRLFRIDYATGETLDDASTKIRRAPRPVRSILFDVSPRANKRAPTNGA